MSSSITPEEMRILLSNSQHKLSALMCKVTEMVVYASDAECEEVFLSLVRFAKKLLQSERQIVEERHRYLSMGLEHLLNATRADESMATMGSKKRELEPAASLVLLASGPFGSTSSTKRAKEDMSPAALTPIHLQHSLQIGQMLYWDFQVNPNVVDILRIDHPPLNIVFTSRPALMGNHVPITMYADLPKLLQLSEDEDTKQSKIALRRLKKAIVKFSKVLPLRYSLRGPLFELPWASKSFMSKLVFEESPDKDNEEEEESNE
jgi:hypothetical protein